MTKMVVVYSRITGRKLGKRPESWLRVFPHLRETPLARARRSPKKKSPAAPATEPSSEAKSNAPEEESNGPSS